MSEGELMTVARVFEPEEDGVEVVFLESARFYKVLKTNPDFESIIFFLRDALDKGFRVEVTSGSRHRDVIERVKRVG
jgi:hypothetical protein